MRILKAALLAALTVSVLLLSQVAPTVLAQEVPAAPAPASTEPASAPSAPATQPGPTVAQVTPAAQAVLEQVKSAYAAIKSVALDGNLSAHFDVAGKDQKQDASFTSTFTAPNFFKHELTPNLLVGSTGQKIYVYAKPDNAYMTKMLPIAAARFKSAEFPEPHGSILREQNPSMALALSEDASAEMLRGIATVDKADDVAIDGKPSPALKMTQADGVATMVVLDPTTSLIRRVTYDLKAYLEQQGVPDVKVADLTIDYTKSVAGDAPAADQFAWTPPEGAREATVDAPADAQGGDQPAMQLVGKPAPDFTLENLKGEKVTLSGLKGSVVVLDFWATWCGPCIASMPALQKIADETQAAGVKVFAVNQQEDKATVDEFMTTSQFTLTALLDLEGKASQEYKAQAIPQTVVIGKDGVVKKVFIGAGPTSEQQLRDAIAESLKG